MAGVAELLKQTAERIINPRFQQLERSEVVEKQPGDLVTVADREAERYLSEQLLQAYPNSQVVGEEGVFSGTSSLETLSAEHVFVIDPIDGTRNFVEGRREHGVMLAELRSGQTTRGWIWQPQYRRLYTVERGSGEVLLNGSPVDKGPERDKPLGAAGQHRRWGFTANGNFLPVKRSSGAACFDYPNVVVGEIDFMYYNNVRPWDHLVGCLMLTEMGGVGRMLSGEDYSYSTKGKGLLVARSEELWELVADNWRV